MSHPSQGQPDNEGTSRRVPGGLRLAAVALLLQAAAILLACAYFVVQTLRGQSHDVALGLSSVVLFVLTATALVGLAVGLLRQGWWARTPTVVWAALLVPVAWSLLQADQVALGIGLLGVALAAGLGVLKTPRHDV